MKLTAIENIKDMIQTQKDVISKLDEEIKTLSNNDFVKENLELKEEVLSLKESLSDTKGKLADISQENKGLKNALYQQIYNEKMSILNLSFKKLDIYFKSKSEGELNKLSQIEANTKNKIDNITEILKENRVDLSDEIYRKLDELNQIVYLKVTKIRETYAKEKGAYSNHTNAEYDRLKSEQLTDAQIVESIKKSNWEAFIGQNLINKVGILLVIIGVIAASQFTYFKLPDTLKCILIFILGGAMLALGEFLNRRKPNLFSIGLTAGGVAILYVGISVGYFFFEVLNMYPAIILCILITTVSFLLSKRYDSAAIAVFSLVGGYLPILSVSESISLIWGAMVYFCILNLFMLLLSFHRKWTVCYFIGLFLNSMGTCYLIINTPNPSESIGRSMISILYVLFVFGIYITIPIISSYSQKIKFSKADIVLMGINTFLSSIMMYFTFYRCNLEDFNGLLAIAFAIIYLLAGKFTETKLSKEKEAIALFYLTGFAFVILVVPIQFGKVWLSLGWLAEGIALIIYGILNDIKAFKKGGYIIGALCLAAFICFDVLGGAESLFSYKYFAITFGSFIILCTYIYKRALSSRFETIYKYVTLVNLWIYCVYVVNVKLSEIISFKLYNQHYLISMLAITVSFFIAFIMPRIKILCDQVVKIISYVVVGVNIIWLLVINTFESPILLMNEIPFGYHVLPVAIIIIMDLISVVALYDVIKSIIVERKLGVEWLPLIVSGYILFLLTQNLTMQFNLSFTNMFISIIYVITALLWIILGFIKRYTLIRKFGLGLSIFSVAKLFILDLSYLTEGNKVISYFALGVSFLAISFVYQYFSKRLEVKGGIVNDD